MIEIENLSKAFRVAKRSGGPIASFFRRDYETVHALTDVSFSVKKGEIVGYIGPNGAGKSTTIKIMSGILVPSSGNCQILGLTPWKSRVSHVKNIGVVFGQRTQLWWDVPVLDSFTLLKDIYRMSSADYERSLKHLVETLSLEPLLNTPVRQLSLGQRMRCEIAAALLHEPQILFLDEPTIGLDAVSKIAVRQTIKKINEDRGVTVVLTTHDMSDIEALASRIMLIGKGQKLYDGGLDALKSQYLTYKRIIVDYDPDRPFICPDGAVVMQSSDERAILSVDLSRTSIPAVIHHLTNTLNIRDITVENQSIEEIIAELYKEMAI